MLEYTKCPVNSRQSTSTPRRYWRSQATSNSVSSSPEGEASSSDTDQQSTGTQPPKVTFTANKKRKKSRHRYFGLGKGIAALHTQVFNTDDYEKKYPDDKLGEELGPNARFYRVYLDEHEKFRFEMVEGWKDSLDVLLVFAGLFSAVVTTIGVEAFKCLQPDYTQLSMALLTQQSMILSQILVAQSGMPPTDSPPPIEVNTTFTAPTNARWVNGLWFASLTLALATALISVVAKQWLQSYMVSPTGTPRDRARLLHMRYVSLRQWRVPAIIGLLPFLLHFSLLLFFCGLVAYLLPIDCTIGIAVGSIALACYVAYFVAMLLPLFIPTCAYKTSLSYIIYTLFHTLLFSISSSFYKSIFKRLWRKCHWAWMNRINDRLLAAIEPLGFRRTLVVKERSLLKSDGYALRIDQKMFKWMHSFSFSPSTSSITLQTACSPSLLCPNIAVPQLLEDLSNELKQSSQDCFDNPVKSERLVLALLSFIRAQPINFSAQEELIEGAAYDGIRLRASVWADLIQVQHLSYSLSLHLALLCHYPDRFSCYWRDNPSQGDEFYALHGLVLPKHGQASKDGRQRVLQAMAAQVLRDDPPDITVLLQVQSSSDAGEHSITEPHLRLVAFLALQKFLFGHTSWQYKTTDLIDALDEVTHEVCSILHDPAMDDLSAECYIALLGRIENGVHQRQRLHNHHNLYSRLDDSEKAQVLEVKNYVQEQVTLYRIREENGAHRGRNANGLSQSSFLNHTSQSRSTRHSSR